MVQVTQTTIRNILTRVSGFLMNAGSRPVSTHSLNPYAGCTFGNSLCGVGCYVRGNRFVTKERPWGSYLEVRSNAAESYLANFDRERRWARSNHGAFSVFCASATDPFLPQERQYRITESVLTAMLEEPPDELILQTHSRAVSDYIELYRLLALKTMLRFHVSIESDQRLPGLPPPATSVEHRFRSCALLRSQGYRVVVIVAPLLPIANPEEFFRRVSDVASAVVIDHFIGGDGTPDGRLTRMTPLPAAMSQVEPRSITLSYRDEIVEIARQIMPGRVGIGADGFAGIYS